MGRLPQGYQNNLSTIIQAAEARRLAVMDVFDTRLNRSQAMLVALNVSEEEVGFVPLAVMCEDNPYEYLLPPKPEGGYYTLAEIHGEG